MKKAKFILLAIVALFTFFFSSDFGLIDVEKTSIITAIAIDKEGEEYIVSAQIAVPEATDTNAENQKTEISAKGKTIGEALKNTGDVTGWYPKLAFCNLIILGDSLKDTNVIKVVDYFAKTLRIQDSATIVLADGMAQEVLSKSTPLDNISSFAIQKIVLKNPGFDREVCPTDVKTFCSGYYSSSSSSFMPIVKIIKADLGLGQSSGGGSSGGQNSSGGSSGSGGQTQGNTTQNKDLFDARYTALFKDGKKTGELSPDLTVMFNALNSPITDTTLAISDVEFKGEQCNFLLLVTSNDSSINVTPNEYYLDVKIVLNLFCKIIDSNSSDSEFALSQNLPLPKAVIDKTKDTLTKRLSQLVDISVQSQCDILKIKEKLYRHHYGQYSKFKDDYLNKINLDVSVNVYGQS